MLDGRILPLKVLMFLSYEGLTGDRRDDEIEDCSDISYPCSKQKSKKSVIHVA